MKIKDLVQSQSFLGFKIEEVSYEGTYNKILFEPTMNISILQLAEKRGVIRSFNCPFDDSVYAYLDNEAFEEYLNEE